MKALTLAILVLTAACGGTASEDDPAMIFPGQVLGARAAVIPAGGQVGLLDLKAAKPGDSGLYILTLTPSVKAVGMNAVVAVPLLGLYARISFGDGVVTPYTFDVDVGRGISFAMRGSYLNVVMHNDSTVDAINVSAYVSEGAFSYGVPQRTLPGQLGGNDISLANPLLPGLPGTDPAIIPNMAKSVTVGVLETAPGATFTFAFFDQAGTSIISYSLTSGDVVDIEVPADAASIRLINTSAANFDGVRFVFDLDL